MNQTLTAEPIVQRSLGIIQLNDATYKRSSTTPQHCRRQRSSFWWRDWRVELAQ